MKATTMNQPLCTSPAINSRASNRRLFVKARGAIRLYATRWIRRYRLRQSLYEMDTQLIEKDIGMPYGSLVEEAHKPFWRA